MVDRLQHGVIMPCRTRSGSPMSGLPSTLSGMDIGLSDLDNRPSDPHTELCRSVLGGRPNHLL